MLCGCCIWEENDMSVPKGTPLYAAEFTYVGGLVTDIDYYKWISGAWVWVASPPFSGTIMDYTFTDCIYCEQERLQLWWQYATILTYSQSEFTKFPDADWSLEPDAPTCKEYTIIADVVVIPPPPGNSLILVWYCGPSNPAGHGLPPAITGVTPV